MNNPQTAAHTKDTYIKTIKKHWVVISHAYLVHRTRNLSYF
jgi:hypothetical protein